MTASAQRIALAARTQRPPPSDFNGAATHRPSHSGVEPVRGQDTEVAIVVDHRNPAHVMLENLAERSPGVAKVLDAIDAKLTTDGISKLNLDVTSKQEQPAAVAQTWVASVNG